MFKKKIGAGILAIVTAIAAMNISVLAETKKETATGTYDGRLWTGTTSYVTGTKKYTMYLTCDWEDVSVRWICYLWNDGYEPIAQRTKNGNYVVEDTYYVDFPSNVPSQMFTEYRVKGVPVGTTNVLSQ